MRSPGVAGPALLSVLEGALLLAAPQAASRYAAPEAVPPIAALEAALPIAVALTVALITTAVLSSLAPRWVSQSELRRLRPLATRHPTIPRRCTAALTAIHRVNQIGFPVRIAIGFFRANGAQKRTANRHRRTGNLRLHRMGKAGRTGGSFARADGPLPNCPWYDAALRAATKQLRAELHRPAQTHRQS
jgi:hypothetical protein